MKKRQTRRHSAGFSILELLLVLVILGILAGIVGVRFAGQSAKAKVTAAKQQLSELNSAMVQYNIDTAEFPSTQEGLGALRERPSSVSEDEYRKGGYLQKSIKNDPWGSPWQYAYPGTHNNDYDLYSFGPDGKQGGDDDITNWSEEDE